jgi:hypothetical protein
MIISMHTASNICDNGKNVFSDLSCPVLYGAHSNKPTQTNQLNSLTPVAESDLPQHRMPIPKKNLRLPISMTHLMEGIGALSFVLAANSAHEYIMTQTPPSNKLYAHLGFISLPVLYWVGSRILKKVAEFQHSSTVAERS